MVKVPEPVQPAPVPVRLQLPRIELLVSVPTSVSSLDPFVFPDPDEIVISKLPVVTPPELPVTVKAPVAVVPNAKHEDEVVKLRLETVSAPAFCASVIVKARAGDPSGLVRVAVQFPLMVLLELPPQPDQVSAMKNMIAMLKCFIGSFSVQKFKVFDLHPARSEPQPWDRPLKKQAKLKPVVMFR
jgi:hypothetical protein